MERHPPTQRRLPKERIVVELGIQLTEGQLKRLQSSLLAQDIPFYLEPPRDPPFVNLAELKTDCEVD